MKIRLVAVGAVILVALMLAHRLLKKASRVDALGYVCSRCGTFFPPAGSDHIQTCHNCKIRLNTSGVPLLRLSTLEKQKQTKTEWTADELMRMREVCSEAFGERGVEKFDDWVKTLTPKEQGPPPLLPPT